MNKKSFKDILESTKNEGEMKKNEEGIKPDSFYYNMVDEDGRRYRIPFLTMMDPLYYEKYVDAMKLKESNPEQFNSLIHWE